MMTTSQPEIRLPTLRQALADAERLITDAVSTLSAEDRGLFGPGSVTWRVVRDPAFAVGGLRALLVEATHPVAMAAVHQHSDYRRDAWRRSNRTAAYVFTITFSSSTQAHSAAAHVRRIHSHVRGEEPASGRPYSADDPDLLLWIHCVSTDSLLVAHETYVGTLSASDADRFVAEQVGAAALIGLPAHLVPANVNDLRTYLANVDGLRVSPPAAEFFRLLVRATMPVTFRPFWALHLLGALVTLPASTSVLYGLPGWLPGLWPARVLVRMGLRAMNLGYSMVPAVRRARLRLAELERT